MLNVSSGVKGWESQMGNGRQTIAVDDMAGRVQQAIWTLRHLAMHSHGMPTSYRVFWPEVVHSREDAYGWSAPKLTRQRPTPGQIAELDRMLPLLYRLDPLLRRLLFLRAIPLGLRRVSKELRCSHMSVKRWEQDALQSLCDFWAEA